MLKMKICAQVFSGNASVYDDQNRAVIWKSIVVFRCHKNFQEVWVDIQEKKTMGLSLMANVYRVFKVCNKMVYMCIKLYGVWYYLEVCLNACGEQSFVKLQDKLV